MPHFAAALFQQRSVAERSPGLLLGFAAAHAPAHQLLGALLNMKADFLGEIVVELAATEDAFNPAHRKFLPVGLSGGCGFAWLEDQRNAFKHALEAGDLLLQMAKS